MTPHMIAALLSLTKDNIPTDIQELLLYGDPARDIRPDTLERAINEVLNTEIILKRKAK